MDLETLLAERDIARFVQGWLYRDLGQWDRLKPLFHPEATISLAWFDGPFAKFVAASEQMDASELRARHVMGASMIEVKDDRAVAETTALLTAENRKLKLGCCAIARFHDLAERRDGVWRIVRRLHPRDGGFRLSARAGQAWRRRRSTGARRNTRRSLTSSRRAAFRSANRSPPGERRGKGVALRGQPLAPRALTTALSRS